MQSRLPTFLAAVMSVALPAPAMASNEVEGRIEAVDQAAQTFVVQGITFHVTGSTDYDDGLASFDDLRVDQKVEVEFEHRDGRHVAKEVERDD